MNLNIGKEVAALRRMSFHDLRLKYAELIGDETWATNNRVWLVKRIAWRLQALAEGDLSERAGQRAVELANDADLRLSPPRARRVKPPAVIRANPPVRSTRNKDHRLRPGTILTRKYKGVMLQVQVLPQGFEFEGALYTSLSAVAKTVTGSHCSGNLFFRLARKGGQP
jgi:Protein of unknown function (DUF2924)